MSDEKKLTDAEIMKGSPFETEAPTAKEEPKKEEKKEEALHKGFTGELKNIDEVLTYTKKLEEQVAAHNAAPKETIQSFEAPKTPAAPAVNDDSFEELIYSNPIKAKELLKAEIRQELTAKEKAEQMKKTFWSEFYEENPDLKDLDRVVQSVVKEKADALQNASLPKAKELIAKESRELVSTIRAKFGVKEVELPPGGGAQLGASSGLGAPKVVVNNGPISFVDQFKKFKRKS